MARKILLGDGISAKIFSFYNPEYLRIAPEREAQIDVDEFQLSILLVRSEAVDNFFTDVGLPIPDELSVPIGYYINQLYHSGNPPVDVRAMVMDKKLSGMDRPLSLFKTEELVAEPYLTRSKDAMSTYQLKTPVLVQLLSDILRGKRDFVHDRVVHITDRSVTLSNGTEIEYSHLVSTIPAYIFWKVYEGRFAEQKVFHSFPMYVARMKRHIWDSAYPAIPDRVMCYFPERQFPFDRVRAVPELQGDELLIESPVSFDGSKELKGARIIRSYANIPPPRVMFLGRYAQWNPDVVVADVIRRSADKYSTEDIWSDQKAFNKRFVAYTPDAQYVQGVVKNYVLHMISEINSLLNTINWKIDATEQVKMEREKILEEWIDVFKFWLSIGHMFGFDVGDFERMYWDKSRRIEDKFSAQERKDDV